MTNNDNHIRLGRRVFLKHGTLVLTVSIVGLLVFAESSWARKWTDNTGRFSIEAELVQRTGDSIVLEKPNGSSVTVPIARLSEADRKYLQSLDQPAAPILPAERTRKFPSFPDGVTEVPPWFGTNAPFDVADFFKAPSPERNAAKLYLRAFLAFESHVLVCFWPAGEVPLEEDERLQRVYQQRGNIEIRLDEAWKRDPKSVDRREVDSWLAEYEAGFEQVAIAQQRPECVFQPGIGPLALLPHAHTARQVTRVAKWRTRRDTERGNLERPIRDLETTLRLSRDLQDRGGMICQLVSVAIDGICCGELVSSVLRADGIQKGHCSRLLAILDAHETESRCRFVEGIRAEYVMARKILYDFQHHTGDISPQSLKDLQVRGPDSPLTWLKLLNSLVDFGAGPIATEKYGNRGAGIPSNHPFITGWTINGKLMSDADYAREIDALNAVYASILDSADQPARKRLEISRDAEIHKPLRDTEVALFFEPSYENFVHALLRADAVLQGTKCLIALRSWQLEHDNPPPDLEALAQAAGMPKVPIDPYSGSSMRMTARNNLPVIYSVGLDGKDDQALVEWDFDTRNPAGDLLFQLSASVDRN